ncbi:hypothetical protein [Rubinisphaera italica]|uniref:Uncharacterized protein n=1 Tax=Rubinisphaera italica TaxID=2527969 RepID=A0A5C5XBT6_9PLAN|nr:hypothetical protein [Rubinisphaera italica]TWT60637.1 hypothetical protein Pan54_13510 [Rubinisphaera italica]
MIKKIIVRFRVRLHQNGILSEEAFNHELIFLINFAIFYVSNSGTQMTFVVPEVPANRSETAAPALSPPDSLE